MIHDFLNIFDYLLLPIYIFLGYRIVLFIGNKYYPKGHPWRDYYFWAYVLKIFGALFISMVYQYYYHGGDTSYYFFHAKVINSAFDESISKWFNLILRVPDAYDGHYMQYIVQMPFYEDKGSYLVCAITAFINLFTFGSYLCTSVVFATVSFSGIWALFRTFAKQYPHLLKYIAIATLFIPSVIIWGSGIFKDTICMFALGWMIYSVFQMLIEKNKSIFNIVMFLLSFYILLVVKVYILIAFLPALALWVFFLYSNKIRPILLRSLVKLFIIFGSFFLFYVAYNYFGSAFGRYSLDNIAKTSLATRDWISYTSGDQGSAYDLGEFDPSLTGLLSKFPQAVNVTLFRPYFWEAGKVIVFLNAIESFLFLWLTLRILFIIGPFKAWRIIQEDPNIQFCLIFSIIFAFSIGISTYNFGALSRYKIPCVPMYLLALILIYYKEKPTSKNLFL